MGTVTRAPASNPQMALTQAPTTTSAGPRTFVGRDNTSACMGSSSLHSPTGGVSARVSLDVCAAQTRHSMFSTDVGATGAHVLKCRQMVA